MKNVAFVLLLVLGILATALAANAPGYHVVNRYRLGGDGGWDYLTFDGANHRLFIARATRVMVVDTDSGKLLGEIPNTPGVHGVALVYDLGRGFISNGAEGTVTVFDLKTLQTIGDKVKVGDNPDAILYDPASKRIFTFNGRSHDATALEAATGKVLGTIPLGGKPEFSATDGKGHVWVNIEDKSEVAQLDPAKLTVLNHWSLSPCEAPSGLALDEKNRRLVVGCDNKLMAIMNADTGKVVATLPVGEGVDAAGFDPGTGLAFTSNGGSGTLTVVRQDSADKYTVVENVETAKSARTMTLDPKTHRVFTVAAQFKPPAPGQRRGSVLPDTFELIVLGMK